MNREKLVMIIPSVLVALVMWGFVMAQGQAEMTFEVPVELAAAPHGLRITGGSNTSVRVSVKGHERFLKGLSASDIKVMVSPGDMKKGEHVYAIRHEDIFLPPTMKVSGVSPSVLHLLVEETRKKTVPVRAVITGLPAGGYAVRSILVRPEKVELEGVRSKLKPVDLVYTTPVDVSLAEESVDAVVRLDLKGLDVSASHNMVGVKVIIRKELVR